MSLTWVLFTFLNVWCVSLFFVLPFGIEHGENPSPIEYAAAPRAQNWKKKLLINTLLSLVITGIIALVISSGLMPVCTLLDTGH